MIFLKNDYIIYRKDIGEEMYFIVKGKVSIVSATELRIFKDLDRGIFGEIAVISNNPRRTRSVIASELTLVYAL